MKKTFWLILICLTAMTGRLAAVTDTAQAAAPGFAQAENYNGSWFGKCLGCPVSAKDSDVVKTWKTDGKATYESIKAQKKARQAAKDKGASNYQQIANTSFWTSDAAWAFNNAANKILSTITKKTSPSDIQEKAGKAKDLLAQADGFLSTPKPLEPLSLDDSLKASLENSKAFGKKWITAQKDAQKEAFTLEKKHRKAAQAVIRKNLLYAKRLLGELPWPKDEEKESVPQPEKDSE